MVLTTCSKTIIWSKISQPQKLRQRKFDIAGVWYDLEVNESFPFPLLFSSETNLSKNDALPIKNSCVGFIDFS